MMAHPLFSRGIRPPSQMSWARGPAFLVAARDSRARADLGCRRETVIDMPTDDEDEEEWDDDLFEITVAYFVLQTLVCVTVVYLLIRTLKDGLEYLLTLHA